MKGYVTNTTALCFALGWQGGTVHQVAEALGCTTQDILDAEVPEIGDYLRAAQRIARGGKCQHVFKPIIADAGHACGQCIVCGEKP